MMILPEDLNDMMLEMKVDGSRAAAGGIEVCFQRRECGFGRDGPLKPFR